MMGLTRCPAGEIAARWWLLAVTLMGDLYFGTAKSDACLSLFCCQHWHNLGPEVFQPLPSESALHCADTDFQGILLLNFGGNSSSRFALLLLCCCQDMLGCFCFGVCVVCLAWTEQQLSCAAWQV